MFDFIAALLNFFYTIWPSYGGAIILLTLVIMVLLSPLTLRQTKSMLAMQRLAPEVKRLRTKYGDDRERMNQEMMALYQANGVNPLGGCLPLLVQAPVLLVMYQVIRGMTRRVVDTGLASGFYSSHAAGTEPDFPERVFNPAYVGVDSELHDALENTSTMKSFGIDLARSAQDVLGDSLVTALPYLLLVIAVGVTTFVQQRQISARNKNNPNAEINPQQQAILKVMPFLLPIFSFGFPAGLVLYWFVSNLFRVGQQAFITHNVYGKDDGGAEIVRPTPGEPDGADGETPPAKPTAAGAKGTAGVDHGRRRPVTNVPKKKPAPKPKPGSTKPEKKTAASHKAGPRTSRRVTPKQQDHQPQAEASAPGRRKKKK